MRLMKIFPEITDLKKEEVVEYPLGSFSGEIVVVDKEEDVDEAVQYLNTQDVLGFDTETRPSFKKGRRYKMSLLQLSSAEQCYLFRLNYIGLPDSLKAVLENKNIEKIGAAIHDDLKDLKKVNTFIPQGFVDLQKWVVPFGISALSVQKLSAVVLGYRVSKSQRLSNWDNDILTPAQQAYAATDAWVCREIYNTLQRYSEGV